MGTRTTGKKTKKITQGKSVKRSTKDYAVQISNMYDVLTEQYGRPAKQTEVARRTGITRRTVGKYMRELELGVRA